MPAPDAPTDTAIITFRERDEAHITVRITAQRAQEFNNHAEAYAQNDPDLTTLTREVNNQLDFLFPVYYNREEPAPGPGR